MEYSWWQVVFVLPVLVAATAFGQGPPSDTCDGYESLTGTDTLPIDLQSSPTVDYFTGCGTLLTLRPWVPTHFFMHLHPFIDFLVAAAI